MKTGQGSFLSGFSSKFRHLANPEEADDRRSATLTLINTIEAGKSFNLDLKEMVIGRGGDIHLIIDDPSVSRRHAMILQRNDKYLISDLESTNGTLVNRERIGHGHVLVEGDKITLGDISFRFSFEPRDDTRSNYLLKNKAVTDPLTLVFNRNYISEVLRTEFDYTRRRKDPLCLVLLGMDYFELLNETWGRETGDQILRETARIISDGARIYDYVARWSGDQFLLVIRGCGPKDSAILAERLRLLVENLEIQGESGNIHATLSAGLAVYDGDDRFDSPLQFINAAEVQLLRAKSEGRNRLCY